MHRNVPPCGASVCIHELQTHLLASLWRLDQQSLLGGSLCQRVAYFQQTEPCVGLPPTTDCSLPRRVQPRCLLTCMMSIYKYYCSTTSIRSVPNDFPVPVDTVQAKGCSNRKSTRSAEESNKTHETIAAPATCFVLSSALLAEVQSCTGQRICAFVPASL